MTPEIIALYSIIGGLATLLVMALSAWRSEARLANEYRDNRDVWRRKYIRLKNMLEQAGDEDCNCPDCRAQSATTVVERSGHSLS
jgi:hypothetical protein